LEFWLEIAYFGLNFDDFWRKIGKNVTVKYSNAQKAQNTSTRRTLVTIHPPVRLVGELKKAKRKKERKTPKTVANWLFAQTTHVV